MTLLIKLDYDPLAPYLTCPFYKHRGCYLWDAEKEADRNLNGEAARALDYEAPEIFCEGCEHNENH